jgi:hypothetical protein
MVTPKRGEAKGSRAGTVEHLFGDVGRSLRQRRGSVCCWFDFLRTPTATRLPFHQVGHPRVPLNLWPLEQVFQPPLLARAIAYPRS